MKLIIRPTLRRLEERISQIENLDLGNLSIDEIKEELKLLFTGYAVSTISLNSGFILYRGVKYDKKPDLLSFLSYPPTEKAEIGRANRKRTPVFYCATDKSVSFYELNTKPGERLVISQWVIEKNLLVNNVGYTDSVFRNLKSNRAVPNFSFGKRPHDKVLDEANVLVQNFLAKRFSQKNLNDNFLLYNLTNAIAEKHFSESDGVEGAKIKGLMYPTILMEANADNIAISQITVDKDYLIFDTVEYVEIVEVKDNVYIYRILDVAFKVIEERIQWKNLDCNWVADSSNELYLVEEGNEIFAYNLEGKLIDPIANLK
jgi:hypothetical protein